MAKKKKKNKTKRDLDWTKAKRLCRLNAETVRMAKELGMNPRKLIKNIPSKSQPWKAPVHVWIRDLYEQMQEKSARKRARRQAEQAKIVTTGDPQPARRNPDPTDGRGMPHHPSEDFGRPADGEMPERSANGDEAYNTEVPF